MSSLHVSFTLQSERTVDNSLLYHTLNNTHHHSLHFTITCTLIPYPNQSQHAINHESVQAAFASQTVEVIFLTAAGILYLFR